MSEDWQIWLNVLDLDRLAACDPAQQWVEHKKQERELEHVKHGVTGA